VIVTGAAEDVADVGALEVVAAADAEPVVVVGDPVQPTRATARSSGRAGRGRTLRR
jgi:hypothetical protein